MVEAVKSERKTLIELVLAEPVLARLATTNPKTMQPHVVPVWFMWDGESVWISSFVSTRKIRELKHNPRGAVLIEFEAGGRQANGSAVGRDRRAGDRTAPIGERDCQPHLHPLPGAGRDERARAAILAE